MHIFYIYVYNEMCIRDRYQQDNHKQFFMWVKNAKKVATMLTFDFIKFVQTAWVKLSVSLLY